MSYVNYRLEISPIPGGIKLFLFWLSWILIESPRVVNKFSFLLIDHIGLYGCTVVQDQCSMVALYCCITSLPVYPSTIHGHCIEVLLDTSNSSILHCTKLKVQTVYCIIKWKYLYLTVASTKPLFSPFGNNICQRSTYSN